MTSGFLFMVVCAAAAWARMEVEIEGRDGWAASLPTWRVESHPLLSIFFGGRPLTGYHVWAFTVVFIALHLPLAWIGAWSWRDELRILASYAVFWLVEDLLWFVFNPAFGLRRFRPEFVWWHKKWFLGLPVDYWVFASFAGMIFAWV